MKPVATTDTLGQKGRKAKSPHPDPGEQQALAEKAANTQSSVKARVDSKNMPDKPPLIHQHMPNSSGRQ